MNTGYRNPYIGPRTFQRDEGHLFFGREREAADLEALATSERLVLFYAQSGAGKSSLINARLVPSLEDKLFEVLPIARLGGDAPDGLNVENIYIFNLLRSLERRETDPGQFQALTLSHFLQKLNEDEDGYYYDPNLTQSLRSTFPTPWPRLLIIDQFEEIFSTHVEYWRQREEFFRQLAQAMQEDPFLWVLLVMREDYVASLDPYVHLLPDGLRVRYYMERLSHEAAVMAIRNPVEGLRPYAAGVAEKLAEDLSRITVQKPDGTRGTEPGQYIEPVQLQVVCHTLWENLPPEGTGITAQDLQDVGDVNESLARYYDQRVREIASAKQVRERQIREWFDQKLITAGGIRSMVLQQRETPPGGLSDDVIRALQSDLVRAEQRGGATWYELTHDRLVEPILASNKEWFENNLSPLQRQALVWENGKRNDVWLLRDQAYMEVLPWVDEHRDELTALDLEFLEASKQERDLQVQAARRTRQYSISITAVAALALLLLVFTIMFARQARQQARLSRAAELAAQSVSLRDRDFLFSLLMGDEAFKALEGDATLTQVDSTLLGNGLANPKLLQFLSGNTGPVVSAVFRPDGKILASGTYGHDILLWDVETRQIVGMLPGHQDIIRSLAFSPDGNMMASGSDDGEIILWDMKTGEPQPLGMHEKAVTRLAFSPDGRLLASGSEDTTIRLWDVESGQEIDTLKGHMGIVRSVAFSPDGNTLASGSDDGMVILWNVKTREQIPDPLKGHPHPDFPDYYQPVLSVAFSPDGRVLASGSYDKKIVLWDWMNGERLHTLSRHSDSVRTLAFSPDGKFLASGSADRSVILWDVKTGEFFAQLNGHTRLINSVSFSPDSNMLASGGGDGRIILWSVAPRQSLNRPLIGDQHGAPVSAITFSSDGKTLVLGRANGQVILWNAETGEFIREPLPDQGDTVMSSAFSPDGTLFAWGNDDGEIILWDSKTEEPQPLGTHEKAVTSLAFSPDGRLLASGSDDRTLRMWNVETREPIGDPWRAQDASVKSLAFSPDGRLLASAGDDEVILWSVETATLLSRSPNESIDSAFKLPFPVNGLAFSPDGRTLAYVSQEIIILLDVRTWQPVAYLSGHRDSVASLAFSPDGKTLAAGSYDYSISLWDLQTNHLIGSLYGPPEPVLNIVFSPDGTTLAAGSAEISIWNLHREAWARDACQRAGRNFTLAEWNLYFPNEAYRQTCWEFPPGPAATP